jgi:hypothetical protein
MGGYMLLNLFPCLKHLVTLQTLKEFLRICLRSFVPEIFGSYYNIFTAKSSQILLIYLLSVASKSSSSSLIATKACGSTTSSAAPPASADSDFGSVVVFGRSSSK